MSEKIPYKNSNYNPHVEMQKEINKKVKVTSRAGQIQMNTK